MPTIVIAGKEYGSGSSRDWAAKGPNLLGVRAAIADSYERIHRSNLLMMGIAPLQFMPGENAESLGLTGREEFSVTGLEGGEADEVTVRADDKEFRARVRLDTPARARVLPPRRHPPVRAAAPAQRVTVDEGWGRVADAILASPVARAASDGQEPPELAPLLGKVRHHAYRIVDADVEGLDPDVVIEATLGAALAVALADRARALKAIQ